MKDSRDHEVLAIDGGGTRCRLVLVQGPKRHEVEGGPANVSTNFDAAIITIRNGLSQISKLSGLSETDILSLPAFIGLAGVTGPELKQALLDALPFKNAKVADDRASALRGALGQRAGVLAHCGTGSFLAARIEDDTRFAGGWGSVLGDEASAQWVGRRALSLTLQAEDGHIAQSKITEGMIARFKDATGIVRFATAASPSDFGQLAPFLTQAAENDDPVARQIMTEGATYLAKAAKDIGWRPDIALCLTGGIGPCYAPYLPNDFQAALVDPAGSPLDGAIALAHDQSERAL